MFNVICYARVWPNNRLYDESNIARGCGRSYDNSKRWLVIVSTLVLHMKAAESFLETSQCTLRTQQCASGEKSGLRVVKREDFIRHRRRSGLKIPDKPKIFIKKYVRHSYHQFYPVLAKIRINRGLLYLQILSVHILLHLTLRTSSIEEVLSKFLTKKAT